MTEIETLLAAVRARDPSEIRLTEYPSLARQLLNVERGGLRPLNVVVLSTFTTEFIDPFLVVEGARHGLQVSISRGGFAQFEQALLDPGTRESWGAIDAIVLQMRIEDVDRNAVVRYPADPSVFPGRVAETIERLESCVAIIREWSDGPILIANFAMPSLRPLTVYEAHAGDSLTYAVAAANRELWNRLAPLAGVYVWDYAGLVASRGSDTWTDPRLWALARAPISSENRPFFAAHLARTLKGVVEPSAKCLVLDLDNTVWGGVVGDDGVEGLQLGDEYPGSAFKEFQRAVLGLRDRGILLAVASRNDLDVARRAIETHPDMLIRWEDFAATRINWNPKSLGLREIAAELNIGIDSLVLFDDNPVERAEVRESVPEVRVIEVPTDVTRYAIALYESGHFDVPSVTEEDRGRARAYQAERARADARGSAPSLEEFLRGLDMMVEIGHLDALNQERVAQLVAKTNQFNLTTRRYTKAQLETMATEDDREVIWLRLRDRFGDAGLVAVAILQLCEQTAIIDSLIMSCRVMNRHVEQALTSHLASLAKARGCTQLIGEYRPTSKNHIVAGLYPALGFAAADGDGETRRFVLDLVVNAEPIPWPETIQSPAGRT